MTPEQEHVYFTWKRVLWTAAIEDVLPAVVVLQDRDFSGDFCVWTQWDTGTPSLKFFITKAEVRAELEKLGVLTHYPDLMI